MSASILSQKTKNSTSYYDVLQVRPNASTTEIKKSYHALAKTWHPDLHQQNKQAAEKRFHAINEAYSHLKSQHVREKYNEILRKKYKTTQQLMAQNDNSRHQNWLMKLLWPNNKKEKA